MKKKLLTALLVVCLVLTMVPAALAATGSGVDATIGKVEYDTLAEAVAAANASTKDVTITVQRKVSVSSPLEINNVNGKKVTIDLNERTITGTGSTVFKVYTDAAIKDGIVKNTSANTACVTTAAGGLTLSLNNVRLICDDASNCDALVLGGWGDKNTVTVNNCPVDAGKTGTAIVVDHVTKLTVSSTDILASTALCVNSGEGTEITVNGCEMKARTGTAAGTAMIEVKGEGAKLTVASSSVITATKGVGVAFTSTAANTITIGCPVNTKTIMTGWASDAKISFTNADVKAKLAKLGYAFDGNIVDGKGIVMIGTSPYSSLEKAFEKGGTVVLLEDLNEGTVEVLKGKSVTLDLAGFSLSADIENNGTLTLTNSKKTGAFSGDVVNNGTLTINDVVATGDIQNEKTVTVKAGTLTGDITGGTASATTVEGGKVVGSISSSKTLTVKGGEITGSVSVEGGTATISGGKIGGGVSVSGGTLTVSGGAVSGSEALYVNGGKATVNAGFFNGDVVGFSDNLSIKAGYFTTDVTDYCPKNSKGEHTLAALPGSYVVDGVTYTYMIAKPMPKGVTVGETEAVGKAGSKLTADQKAAVADLIAGVEASGLGDLAAAKAAKTEAADATDVRRFNNNTSGSKVDKAEELTVVVVPTVNVEVVSYKNGEWTLKISATLVTKLTDGVNYVNRSSSAASADAEGEEVVVTIPLPEGMREAYIYHEVDDINVYYPIESSYGEITFATSDGLGQFVLTEVKPVAKIGELGYESLNDAVDAVKDGETIVLVADCSDKVKIGREVSFFFEIEAGVDFTGYLKAGSDYDDESTVDGFYDIVEDRSSGSSGGDDDDDDLDIEVDGDDDDDDDDWDDEDDFDVNDWTNPYKDVKKGVWYYKSVAYVSYYGMMNGTDKGDTFSPRMATTRGMVVTMLARLDGVSTKGSDPWYKAGMEWAVRNGITTKTNANSPIAREEIVEMMWKFAGAPFVRGDYLAGFPDADEVSASAEEAMNWAVAVGLVEGTDKGLEPQGETCRDELATLFMRLCTDVLDLDL